MCNYSAKLIPWLDRELGEAELADVQRHLHDCIECRCQLAVFEQVSKTFNAYCDAVMAAKSRRKQLRWLPALATAAAAVAIATSLLLRLPRAPLNPPAPAVIAAAPPAITLEKTPAPRKPLPRRHTSAPPHAQAAKWLPTEPAIQIAIPADSMFPPGAVPEGFTFTADVSLAADGSPQQVGLQPRLIGFERRLTQP
jgi:hypothetical protein